MAPQIRRATDLIKYGDGSSIPGIPEALANTSSESIRVRENHA